MKELSIEEKAKRYDDAIEKAKEMHKEGMMSERIEYIFPELAESEDERIRKWIVKELESKYVVDNKVNNLEADKALAWLEKQSEQKPSKMYVSDILYEHIRNIKACLDDMPESHKYSDYYFQAYYNLEEAMELIKVEENHVEWNEEILFDWIHKNARSYVNSEYNEFHNAVEYDGSFDAERMIFDLKDYLKSLKSQLKVRVK